MPRWGFEPGLHDPERNPITSAPRPPMTPNNVNIALRKRDEFFHSRERMTRVCGIILKIIRPPLGE